MKHYLTEQKEFRFFRILLLKAYFDRGLGVTSYVKYLIALFGLYSWGTNINVKYVVILGIAYIFSCFIVGWLWFKFRLIDTENEIGNLFNPFQREVREKFK